MHNINLVLQKMIANPERITDTYPAGNEIYFKYSKTCFSVSVYGEESQGNRGYSFTVYPNWAGTLEDLLTSFTTPDLYPPDQNASVSYKDSELPEIRPNLIKLWSVATSKSLHVDEIFDRILSE